jgi:hypothetical protein
MHYYFGWKCLVCGDDIPFAYLGTKLTDKMQVRRPSVLLVKCRTCGCTKDYTHVPPRTLEYPAKLSDDDPTSKPN